MPKPDLPMAGGCRCGATRFEITAPPMMTMACHCTGCQKMASSAYSLSMMVAGDAFRVTKGDTVQGGLKGPQIDHRFCPECMSWMYTQFSDTDAYVNVRPTMLDDPSWFAPYVESWTSEKLPWVTLPVEQSYPQFPPKEDRPKLGEGFAAWF
ncbi:GFA family protein [Sulfitobacter sp. D35]|uniref:GFA family protein n=1 Tax=Sulfitobacter sp. D35 TaxID=3083252 RepID=UPI00296FADD6|nr:GFA family protein [Sulfitobacter sp. D35]MDW4499270.1 GFA family protein [Sulfitobacter sp. D35]